MRYGASLCSGVAIMTASLLLLLLSPFAVEGSATSATMRFMEHLHGSEGRGGSLDRGGAEAQQLYGEKSPALLTYRWVCFRCAAGDDLSVIELFLVFDILGPTEVPKAICVVRSLFSLEQ